MNMQIDREAFMRMLGLDVPVHVQYGRWMEGILLRGTLGKSLFGDFAVEERILASLPVTLQLGVISLVIAQVIALPVGIYSAVRQDTAADYAGRTIAVIGLATPNFWLGIMVVIFPAIWWGWSPPMEWFPFAKDPAGNIAMFIIPSLILGTALSATTMRMTRTMMLEVLRQDYIRTAWSKGLKERAVVVRHALKNAFIPNRHPDRRAVADPGGGLGDHGEHLQPAGAGPSDRDPAYQPGLPAGVQLGRDLLSRLIYGARLSLFVGLTATALNVVVAVLIGGTSGFFGGRLDLLVQRFVDAWMAFPGLLILLTVMSIAGKGLLQIILVLGISGGISGSRITRSAVIAVKESAYFPLLSGRGRDRLLEVDRAGAPRAAQHRGARDRHLQHQHRRRDHLRGVAELPGIRPARPRPARPPPQGRHRQLRHRLPVGAAARTAKHSSSPAAEPGANINNAVGRAAVGYDGI